MNKTLRYTLSALFVGLVLSGCGSFSKVVNSKDPELKYQKAFEYYDAGKYSKSAQLFESIPHFFVGTAREDTIVYYTGLSYYRNRDYDMSGYYFDYFRKNYGRSPFLEEAEYMLAKGYYAMSPTPNRDQRATRQALMAIDEYLERYPNSVKKEALEDNVKELVQKLHDKAFINAKSYYTTRRYKAAVVALKNAIDQYPESSHREELMYLIAKSNYLLAENSVTDLQRDRYLDMMDAYYNFVSEYPGSKYTRELDKMQDNAKKFIASFSDEELKDTDKNGN